MSTDTLISVDPGGQRSGVAIWRKGQLIAAGHVADVLRYAAQHVDRGEAHAWVVEAPHIRGARHATRSGVDALRHTIARIRSQRVRGSTWRTMKPHQWKGNVPKGVHHKRAWRELSARERLIGAALDPDSAVYQPDTADAIALGLTCLGRIGRGGVRSATAR